jgi:hypothetical protein
VSLPVFPDGTDIDAAADALEELEFSDGLPLVPPTEARMAAMLAGVAEPDRQLGLLPPLFGELTPRAVAYQCVLAGAAPDALPVVLTAALATLAPDFNVLGLLTTTGTPAVATIVHGPAADRLGMNGGANMLGPGNAANATLGRAISLVLRNIGGAREGVGDMATMGQPGKYSFCFPEGAAPGFPSLARRRDIPEGASAVTVLGVSGTVEVLPLDDRDTPEAILSPIAAAMMAVPAVAGSGRARPPGEQVFLLPPELAAALAKHGFGLRDVQDYLYRTERVEIPGVGAFERASPVAAGPDAIHPIVAGGAGIKMTYLPLWAGGTRTETRALIDLESAP